MSNPDSKSEHDYVMLITFAAFALVMSYLFYAAFVQNPRLAKRQIQKDKAAQEQAAPQMESPRQGT